MRGAITYSDELVFPSTKYPTYGLSKREYFAAMAMQGLLAGDGERRCEEEHIAAWATKQADALIDALNEEKTDAVTN